MTLRTHGYFCFFASSLSFIVLLFCLDLVSEKGEMAELLAECLMAFVGTFASVLYLDRKNHVPHIGDEEIGNSNIEIAVVGLCVWLPVIWCGYAMVTILFMNENFRELTWTLVVLAGNSGAQSAMLYELKR
jgi:hypothetical protein